MNTEVIFNLWKTHNHLRDPWYLFLSLDGVTFQWLYKVTYEEIRFVCT